MARRLVAIRVVRTTVLAIRYTIAVTIMIATVTLRIFSSGISAHGNAYVSRYSYAASD